ncbi:hypothetical protein EDB89DRAFT_2188133 [Lactarius sanguifluus]|nr:hypothetical protein EDB89DRAFT_2188133 [Lactarius sanguifluus]
MDHEDNVLQYYRQFLCYSAPLLHTGHLSEEERDAAFWYGFHPDDREVLWPHLLGKNPFQPSDIPFHFKDVFVCAQAAFAYDGSSFWSHVKQFQSPSVRLTRTVTSNTETSNLNKLPSPPQSTPQLQFPSSSLLALESQNAPAHSATLDQPEPVPTFSITVSTLHPSASSSPTHTHSLTPLAAADVPEISSTHSLSSTASIPSPTTSISSDFECLPSAMVDQPKFKPKPVCLSSITPTSPCLRLPFTPSLVCVPADDDPEIAPTLLHSIPSTPYAPSLASSATDSDPISTSTPPSSSLISSTFLPSVTEEQPEPELESMPSITPSSTFAPIPPSSSTFLPSPVSMRSAMNSQPKIESALVSKSAIPLSIDHVPEIASAPGLSLHPSEVPANLAPSPSTFELLSVLPASSDFPPVSVSPSLVLGDLELEFSPTASCAVGTIPLSSPQSFESMSSLHEPSPILPAPLKTSMTVPVLPNLSLPQRPPRIKMLDLDSSPLEVTSAPTSPAIPFVPQSQELPTVHEVSSTFAPPLTLSPPLRLSCSGLIYFNFVLALISTAVFISTLLNISKTLSTFTRKLWSKNQDSQNSTPGYKTGNDLAHRLQLRQNTPCG